MQAHLAPYDSTDCHDAAQHLHQAHREAQERKGPFPGGIASDGGIMQCVSSGVLQELQQQGEAQSEVENSPGGAAQGGGGAIPSRQKSPTSVSLSGGRSSSSSTSPPLFVQAPAREPLRESPPELLGGRDRSRSELSLSLRTASERPEPGSGAAASPPWPRAAAEVSSQLLGRRAGADASLRRLSPESMSESIQQYNSDMRALLAKTPAVLSHSLTVPQTPGSQQSCHTVSSISSITSEESYASSFAYSLRRSKPDLRLLRKSSKPSQHLKPKPSVPKAPPDGSRSPSFYRPRVVEDTRIIASKTKDLTPSPLPGKLVTLTLPELLNSDPAIKAIKKVTTFGSDTSQRKQKAYATALKPAISRPSLWRSTSEQPFVHAGAPVEPPRRPPAKATRQLRFEDSHRMYSGRSSSHDFVANSHLKLADAGTGFHKNSHLNKHYHDVTPPEDEPGILTRQPSQHDDSYFHTFGADTMYNEDFVPAQTRASDKLRSGVQVIAVATLSKPTPSGGSDRKTAASITTAPSPRKQASSTLFTLFRKTTIKDEVKSDTPRNERKCHKPRPEARRFGTPEHSAKSTPSPKPETPTIRLEASPNSARSGSIVPELRMPSYFARPKMRHFDSECSSLPSPGHAISPGSSEGLSDSGSPTPYPHRSRRHHRSSSEALSPMRRSRNSPSIRSRSPYVDSGEANGTETNLPSGLVSHVPGPSDGSFVTQAPGRPEESAEAFPTTTSIDAKLGHLPTRRETVVKRKSSMWKGMMHGLRKMSSLGFLDQEQGATDDTENVKRHRLSVMPKLSLPRIKLQASRSSLNVRDGRLVRKASRASRLQLEQAEGEDEAHAHEQTADYHRDGQRNPEVPVPRAIRPEDLIVTEFEQTPFSKRYYDAIRAERQVIRALMDETIEEDDEADDEIVLGFEQNVPDHLPNSPLCPLSPKHTSGGKAICPLHGKYKRRESLPSHQHKVEIVFDTREELLKAGPPTLGVDGTGLFLSRLDVKSYPSTGLDRRRIQTSSMGSDGTESILVQLDVSDVWSRPRERRLKQRDSEHRGRTLERGESALDIRHRRREKGAGCI